MRILIAIIAILTLPVEIVGNIARAILYWIGCIWYVLTKDNWLCDKVGRWYERSARVCRTKPLG